MVTDTSPVVDTQDDEAFRASVREFIAANYPPGLPWHDIAFASVEGPTVETPGMTAWRKAVGERGWGTPTWPAEYGGGGLSRQEARVLQEEMARIGARNPVGGMGVMMFGPTLIEYGSEALKRQHLPGIIKGEVRWCQGYSEPGAGSDLAGLQTRAEDKGDHWLVNGSKIWTSGANLADRCFCLVRTDTTKKHEGISFLLIDMRTPGVETRPIRLINGTSPFCETFFTDVKVPKDQLVGPLNGGWTIAKRLLEHERQGIGARPPGGTPDLPAMAKRYVGADDDDRLADGDLRARISTHLMAAQAFKQTLARTAAEAKAGAGPNAAVSILKNAGASVSQERLELALEIMGVQGLGWEGDLFTETELEIVRTWLGSKAYSIYGGSQEIQNNIIAKRVLGLLDHQ